MNKRSYRRSGIPERETLVNRYCINGNERRKPVHHHRPRPKKFRAAESRISANAAKK